MAIDSLQDALAHLKLKSACIIGVDSDILFPLHQQREIADALAANGVDFAWSPCPPYRATMLSWSTTAGLIRPSQRISKKSLDERVQKCNPRTFS